MTRPLGPRQREVVGLIAEGLTNKQIAEKLGVSTATVRNTLKDVMNKTDTHTRVELAVRYTRNRVIEELMAESGEFIRVEECWERVTNWLQSHKEDLL
jgi:DNA-binding CsgD family transcriptional regulator